jgi:hypothetical protein
MKLTWFGGTTVRIHIGGAILVLDPAGAPDGIDAAELVSGADRVIGSATGTMPAVDPLSWRPRPVPRLLDEDEQILVVNIWSLGSGALLVEGVGEPPLVLVPSELPETLGNWAEKAVFLVFGAEMVGNAAALAQGITPRLIVLAGTEDLVDETFAALGGRLQGTGLVSLEAGLALEI